MYDSSMTTFNFEAVDTDRVIDFLTEKYRAEIRVLKDNLAWLDEKPADISDEMWKSLVLAIAQRYDDDPAFPAEWRLRENKNG